jgi:DNA-directed RNA polymerase subunit RPC12/RpoP
MIKCNKCGGKVFVDLTFTENKNYETFCLRCGKRNFVGTNNPLYIIIRQYVKSALVA